MCADCKLCRVCAAKMSKDKGKPLLAIGMSFNEQQKINYTISWNAYDITENDISQKGYNLGSYVSGVSLVTALAFQFFLKVLDKEEKKVKLEKGFFTNFYELYNNSQ